MNLTDARRFRRSSDPRVRDEAKKTLDAAKARRSRVRPKRAAGVAKKKASREERRDRVSWVRSEALARADGRCELCDAPLLISGVEVHHTISGPSRRLAERPDTFLVVCLACHRALHRNDRDALRSAKEWALMHGFREAHAAIDRRLSKLTTTEETNA